MTFLFKMSVLDWRLELFCFIFLLLNSLFLNFPKTNVSSFLNRKQLYLHKFLLKAFAASSFSFEKFWTIKSLKKLFRIFFLIQRRIFHIKIEEKNSFSLLFFLKYLLTQVKNNKMRLRVSFSQTSYAKNSF